jgi:Tol biopolymer transport system component
VKDSGIVFRDLQTSSDKEILPHDRSGLEPVFMIDVSPDGQQVAVYGQETETKAMVLKVIPASGGEPRELLRLEKESPNRQPLAWTRDGQSLLLIRNGSEETRGLWRIPIDGGKCQRLEMPWAGWFMDLSVHPDGRRIAFVADQPREEEVWVMQNFLPTPTVADSGK